jgi:hypothetical protein
MVVALGVGNPIGWKRYPWFEATKVGYLWSDQVAVSTVVSRKKVLVLHVSGNKGPRVCFS